MSHIERMHEMSESLAECLKAQFDKGVEKLDSIEVGRVIDMLKDLSEGMYYASVVKAMGDREYHPEVYDPVSMPEMFTSDMLDERYRRGYEDGQKEAHHSKVDTAMRNYENYKRNYSDSTPMSKAKELEKLMHELEAKADEYLESGMTPEEKNVLRTMGNKIIGKF